MTLDTRFALFAVLHESDSGTLRRAAMSAIRSLSVVNRTCRGQLISVANDPDGTWSECAFVIQMEWRLHLISLVSNADLLFSQTAP